MKHPRCPGGHTPATAARWGGGLRLFCARSAVCSATAAAPLGRFFSNNFQSNLRMKAAEIARTRAHQRIQRGRIAKPRIGLGFPHALPPAGVRGVAGVAKPEKNIQLPLKRHFLRIFHGQMWTAAQAAAATTGRIYLIAFARLSAAIASSHAGHARCACGPALSRSTTRLATRRAEPARRCLPHRQNHITNGVMQNAPYRAVLCPSTTRAFGSLHSPCMAVLARPIAKRPQELRRC